jgi:hypothetical protein
MIFRSADLVHTADTPLGAGLEALHAGFLLTGVRAKASRRGR